MELKGEVKYWYAYCGHKSGWCLSGKGCTPCNPEGRPVNFSECALFSRKHPLTGQYPHLTVRSWAQQRRKAW